MAIKNKIFLIGP